MNRKTVSLIGLALILCLASSIITYAVTVAFSFSTIIEAGSMVSGYSYIVFVDGSTYYAKNGITGAIDYSGTNFTTLIAGVIATMPTYGGVILLKTGYYEGHVVINRDNIHLEGEGCGAIQTNLEAEIAPTALTGSVIKPEDSTNGITLMGYTPGVGWFHGVQIRNLGIWFTTENTGHGITTGTAYNVTTVTNLVIEHVKILNNDKNHYALQLCNFLYSTFRDILSWGGPLLDIYANSAWLYQGNSIFEELKASIFYDLVIDMSNGPYPIFIHRNGTAVNTLTNLCSFKRLQVNNPTAQSDSDYYTFVCWDLSRSTLTDFDFEGANLRNQTVLVGSCTELTFTNMYMWEMTPGMAYLNVAGNNRDLRFENCYLGHLLDGNHTNVYDTCQIFGTINPNTQAAFINLNQTSGKATLASSQSSITVSARFIGPNDYVLLTIIDTDALAAGESLKVDTINYAPTNTFAVNCIDEGTASVSIVFYWKIAHATP